MIVNRSNLDAVFNGLKTLYNQALVAQTGTWMETAMEVPSSGTGEDYAWLSRFPRFRKWVGDKVVKNITAGKYFVKKQPVKSSGASYDQAAQRRLWDMSEQLVQQVVKV